jgi:parallel beta-helix repeat protein
VLADFRRSGELWIAPNQNQRTIKRGTCGRLGRTCEHPIGVFVDGRPLVQVESRDAVAPGRFFHDRQRGEIAIGENPTDKTVEVSTVRFALRGTASNVLIRGLIVEKYFNPAQEGAVQGEEARGWRVEDCEFRFNSGAGVSVGSGGAILNSRIHHNGQLGATAGGSDILIEGNEIWANNMYGFDYTWEAGGVKVTDSERVTFRRNHSHHNGGPGLWCDERCRDTVFEGNIVEFNDDAGIFLELSQKAVIRDNTLRENGLDRSRWYWGPDIQIAASEGAEVTNNRITVRPGGRAIMLIDQNRPRKDGGYYKTRNNHVHDNHVLFLGAGSAGGVSDAKPGAENYAIIENGGNRFEANTYEYVGASRIGFIWGETPLDFAGFRKLGQEQRGSLTEHAAPLR